MISLLISSYNYDPTQLVKDLCAQIKQLDVPAEIIIGNDCSESKFMPFFTRLEKLQNVSLYTPDNNLGRSKIRNTLADRAKFPFLLFIDGDAEVLHSNFIKKYLEFTSPGKVVCGGTAYRDKPPIAQERLLRWKYGIKREARPADQRNKATYNSFSSFNFLIHADDFKRNCFDENIVKYGHEDTIFGIGLRMSSVEVEHIDNQLIHAGIDTNDIFLQKTSDGVYNLSELEKSYEHKELLYEHIRLLKRYRQLRKCGLHYAIRLVGITMLRAIKRNLQGPSPSLRMFDLYKLILINDIKD